MFIFVEFYEGSWGVTNLSFYLGIWVIEGLFCVFLVGVLVYKTGIDV